MWAKKLIYTVLASGPFLMMAGIAIHARTTVQDWQAVEYGPTVSKAVLDYAPVISVSQSLSEQRAGAGEPEVRVAMDRWLWGYRSGELADIPAAEIPDNGTEGARAEIIRSRNRLFALGLHMGDCAARRNDWHGAHRWWIDCMELLQVNKYGSMPTVIEACRAQKLVLKRLDFGFKRLRPEDQATASARLASLSLGKHHLARIADRLEVLQLVDLVRLGEENKNPVVLRMVGQLASLDDSEARRLMSIVREDNHTAELSEAFQMVQAAHDAHHYETAVIDGIGQILAGLSAKAP